MSIGKKIIVGPALTLHAGWQLVPLDATRKYGPKVLYLVASTAADVSLSTNASDIFILKSGTTLQFDLDGAPFCPIEGTEILSNGNCSATGAWSVTTGWRFGRTGHTGKANHATGQAGALSQVVTPESGEIYELDYKATFTKTGATGGVTPSFGGVNFVERYVAAIGSVEHYVECIKATNATGRLRFTPDVGADNMDLDDISLVKITGSQLLFAKGTAGVILQVMFTI